MTQKFTQVDAFTDRPFTGNPAAVCILSGPADEKWMQQVAAEMNLSETAFLHPEEGGYRLRWFTPTTEVKLCGHATLASAHVLAEQGRLQPGEEVRFHTKSGLLKARLGKDKIELDFPAYTVEPMDPPAAAVDALGVTPIHIAGNEWHCLIEVEAEDIVRAAKPDFTKLRAASDTHCFLLTSRGRNYDFVSRFFAPAFGINEDPVTGSAHCTLGPYWGKKLEQKEMSGYQASARGGIVHVRLEGDRVILGGQAVTVARGELLTGAD